MLSFDLGEELVQLQTTVRDFAAKEIRPALRATEEKGPSADLQRKFDELGLLTLDWPEAAGGQGLGASWKVVVEEEVAFGDLGSAFALDRTGAAAVFLKALGTGPAHDALKSLSDKGRAAFAATEDGKGQDGFRTAAKREGNGWTLSGKKAYVLGGGEGAAHLVLAQVEAGKGLAGAGAFWVPADAGARAGATWTSVGVEALPLREVVFEGVKVKEAARLDAPGTLPAVLRGFYDRLALVTAARAVGVSRASFEYAVRYAEERVAFGKPIGHFQAIAFLLSDMTTAVEAARWLTWKAAWAADKGECTVEAAAAQAQALETAFFCTNSAVQVLGGAGFVQDHPVEKWMRDTKVLQLYGLHAQAANATLAAAATGQATTHPDLYPLGSLHPGIH